MARGQLVPSGIAPDIALDILNAESLERRTVRVLFADAPKAVLASASDDALNTDNWVIIPRGDLLVGDDIKAYITVEVVRVDVVVGDPLSLDVVVDLDFTFGVTYEVTASQAIISAENIGGWTLTSTRVATFEAFDPACRSKPMPQVYDWLGSAVRKCDDSRDIERMAAVMQDLFEQMKSLADCQQELFNPLLCPEEFLDARLEAFGNPFELITSEMTLVEKRRVALQLVNLYRLKGTEPGVLRALEEMLGFSNVYLLPLNRQGWRLEDASYSLGSVFKLGERRWSSSPIPPPLPHHQGPLNPEFPPNWITTGTAFLFPHTPSYIHSGLSDGSEAYERRTRHIKLGTAWNLTEFNAVRTLWDPASDPDITPTEEKGRKEIYSYRIAIDAVLTAEEISRVAFVARYMQPAGMHLQAVITQADEPNANRLGTARLNNDFRLQ